MTTEATIQATFCQLCGMQDVSRRRFCRGCGADSSSPPTLRQVAPAAVTPETVEVAPSRPRFQLPQRASGTQCSACGGRFDKTEVFDAGAFRGPGEPLCLNCLEHRFRQHRLVDVEKKGVSLGGVILAGLGLAVLVEGFTLIAFGMFLIPGLIPIALLCWAASSMMGGKSYGNFVSVSSDRHLDLDSARAVLHRTAAAQTPQGRLVASVQARKFFRGEFEHEAVKLLIAAEDAGRRRA